MVGFIYRLCCGFISCCSLPLNRFYLWPEQFWANIFDVVFLLTIFSANFWYFFYAKTGPEGIVSWTHSTGYISIIATYDLTHKIYKKKQSVRGQSESNRIGYRLGAYSHNLATLVRPQSYHKLVLFHFHRQLDNSPLLRLFFVFLYSPRFWDGSLIYFKSYWL